MKDMYPERTRVGIESDGAGCYTGKFIRLAFPLLSQLSGVQVMFHSTGEAQCNKSVLDGHFGVAGPAVAAVVASGKQDCTTAQEVVRAHKMTGAIQNTVVREVHIDRSKEGKLDNRKALSDVPVRSIAFSAMEYDSDGTFVGVRFFKHAGFGDGKLITRAELDSMWGEKQGSTGGVLIDWPADHDAQPIRRTLQAGEVRANHSGNFAYQCCDSKWSLVMSCIIDLHLILYVFDLLFFCLSCLISQQMLLEVSEWQPMVEVKLSS